MGKKFKGISYKHVRRGNTLKVEIRDDTRRLEYRNKINLQDKNAVIEFLLVLEKYTSLSIYEVIKGSLPI